MCKVNDFKTSMKTEFHYSKKLDSTNAEAMRKMSSVDENVLHVFYASYQSEGRGQAKHKWISPIDMNVLMSILIKNINISSKYQFSISHATTLTVLDFLREECPEAIINIKWPNDIFLNAKKIAGILIENLSMANTISAFVAGIGLNLNQQSFNSDLPNAVSLYMLDAKKRDVNTTVEVLTEKFQDNLLLLQAAKFEKLHAAYDSFLYKKNERTEFLMNDKTFIARILRTDYDGRIILEMNDGKQEAFYYHEVQMKT